MKTAVDRRTVISMDSFSPDSDGKRNPSVAMEDIKIHGSNMLRT